MQLGPPPHLQAGHTGLVHSVEDAAAKVVGVTVRVGVACTPAEPPSHKTEYRVAQEDASIYQGDECLGNSVVFHLHYVTLY